ncbi:putative tryptophan--tRNA ligase, mitochondrial [Apostichopus japonicus]|uniref:tryptophan--tRNA ligase n=1 Tax=Stichopus japonicus TaxID=307972 RepID=A0A2G8L8Q4_STIJA|nr:putative tryptophan--tRNA ligase, mitochondrial [Apostichopus japonicus]
MLLNFVKCSLQISQKKVIFSGIQPTGVPHLGNFFGAIEKWVDMQNDESDALYVSIVDLHSISLPQDPDYLRNCILSMTATLLAVAWILSDVFYFNSLIVQLLINFVLNDVAVRGTGRSKAGNDKKAACVGLFSYPVLQAADILLYRSTHVPVGDDQLPHLELAQQLSRLFNQEYGTKLVPPEPIIGKFKRIKSLREPEKKMSKSDADPKSRIELTDDKEAITLKLKKAVTDFTSDVTFEPDERPGVANLVTIHAAASGQVPEEIPGQVVGMTTAEYKMIVAKAVNERLAPVRERYFALMNDEDYLMDTLHKGAEKAKLVAENTLTEVKRCVGLL